MEVEAWFIGEHTHFARIDAALTAQRILQDVGIDLLNSDIEARNTPADDLNNIYQLANLNYTKSKNDVTRTVNALSYDSVRESLPQRTPSFRPLTDALDSFF